MTATDPLDHPTFGELGEEVRRRLGGSGRALLDAAYDLACEVHEGQSRKTGEPFICHPMRVALRCLQLSMSAAGGAAAVLHDTLEDDTHFVLARRALFGEDREDNLPLAGDFSRAVVGESPGPALDHRLTELAQERKPRIALRQAHGVEAQAMLDGLGRAVIRKRCGNDVTRMVWALTKIAATEAVSSDEAARNTHLKVLREAAEGYPETVFIKVLDRWDNAKTLDVHRPAKRLKIASETLAVYAPLASALGLFTESEELADDVLRVMQPKAAEAIVRELERAAKAYRPGLLKRVRRVQAGLADQGLGSVAEVTEKSLYAIYREMQAAGLERVQDACPFILTLVLDDRAGLYLALDHVHREFVHIRGFVRDFVHKPKHNGYRSLHTMVLTPGRRPMRIQVVLRTVEMEHCCHIGLMDELSSRGSDSMELLRELFRSVKDSATDQELQAILSDTYYPEVSVTTPRGDQIQLPEGATALDLAYRIHTEIGNHAVAAKIRGIHQPLHTRLEEGDSVEILTRKELAPTYERLSWVHTPVARRRLAQNLGKLDREAVQAAGTELLDRCFDQLELHGQDRQTLHDEALRRARHCDTDAQLHRLIYAGLLTEEDILHRLLELDRRAGADERRRAANLPGPRRFPATAVKLQHAPPHPRTLRMCRSCSPRYPAPVAAWCEPELAIIHRKNCLEIQELLRLHQPPARLFDAAWVRRPAIVVVRLELQGTNRNGLAAAVTAALAKLGIGINSFQMEGTYGRRARGLFALELPETEDATELIHQLTTIDGVDFVALQDDEADD